MGQVQGGRHYQYEVEKLTKAHLESLVRTLKLGTTTGKNKAALQGMINTRFNSITEEQFNAVATTIQRGAGLAALPAPPTTVMALQEPAPVIAALTDEVPEDAPVVAAVVIQTTALTAAQARPRRDR